MIRAITFLALISVVVACGDAPPNNENLQTTTQVSKSFSSVSEHTFTWESGGSLKMNREIFYATKSVSGLPDEISASIFLIEDLAAYKGELKCKGSCTIVSKTAPSNLICKLNGTFRYEHVTDAATLPSTVLEKFQGAFGSSQDLPKRTIEEEDREKKEQRDSKRLFDKTFNEVKAKFDRIRPEAKHKFQLDTDAQVTYEGEAIKAEGKLQATGIGKITLKDGTWVITKFSAGKNSATNDGILTNVKENFMCAGPMTTSSKDNSWKLDMATGSICLRNGKYEKQ